MKIFLRCVAAIFLAAAFARPALALDIDTSLCQGTVPALAVPACSRIIAAQTTPPAALARAYAARARAYLQTGGLKPALDDANAAITLNPADHTAWATLGDVHHKLGNAARAWKANLKAMALNPEFDTVCEYG